MDLTQHPIAALLCRTDLSAPDSFAQISTRVRDRDDVHALRCRRSGVVILDRVDHIAAGVYEDRGDLSYWGAADRQKLLQGTFADDGRRAAMLRSYVTGRTYLDIGTGLGGVLDLVTRDCAQIAAVEPQAGARNALHASGYTVFKTLAEAPTGAYDVVSAFHVFEHVPDQIGFLTEAKARLKPGGTLILEVPHANDALMTLYRSRAFLDFTLWSQHLILHTRASLRTCLDLAGFKNVRITGAQRYPLANHLYWLLKKKPGGHEKWKFLRNAALDRAYEKTLAAIDRSDTLIAIASV